MVDSGNLVVSSQVTDECRGVFSLPPYSGEGISSPTFSTPPSSGGIAMEPLATLPGTTAYLPTPMFDVRTFHAQYAEFDVQPIPSSHPLEL